MSRTPIQVSFELKDKLEDLKSQMNVKSLPDVVERLIQISERFEQYKIQQKQEKHEEANRSEREDVYLGEEAKKQLHEFQQVIKLRQPAHAVEFLLANYDGNLELNKYAFDTYIRLKG